MKRTPRNSTKGFTLVEILVVLAITGLVMTSLYSVYMGMQRTTYNQEEVVDVQQSLRVALDLFSRDVRMAGFLIPSGTVALAAGSNASTLNLLTASTRYQFATLDSDQTISGTVTPTSEVTFTLTTPEMTDPFAVGDTVRLIRPNDGSQPVNVDLTITAIVRAASTMTVRGFTNSFMVLYKAGDLFALVPAGAADPSTISWTLNATSLTRQADGGVAQEIAADVSDLQFAYLLNDGTEADANNLQSDDLENTVAIRLVMTSDTDSQLDRVVRQRTLATIARIRN